MKRLAIPLLSLVLAGLPLAQAGHAEVNVNVNVGLPQPPPAMVAEPPEFIYPAELGFYVAVGVPHDLFYVGSTYYIYRDRGWYAGRHYDGPWRYIDHSQLPPGLRKHKFERIRHYRDEEYRRYRSEQDGYRGRRFRPDKEWKEERKQERREEKQWRKEERRYEKEERKHDNGEGRGHGRHDGRDD